MQEFGVRLRQLRKEREMSLERLARKAGTQKGYLSGIENGRLPSPSAKIVRRLARALRVFAKDLLLIAYIDRAPAEIKGDLEHWVAERSVSSPKTDLK